MRHPLLLVVLSVLTLSCHKADPGKGTDPGSGETYVAAERIPVFYEANPKVFAATGSLKAITGRLDAIRALGTDVLWLMPIHPVGQEKSVGSPYCVKDYEAVNDSYGTLDDLKALVSAAHQKKMKVILDWVANHTAWDHPWVKAHPDWYTQEGGQIIPPKGMGWNDVADLDYGSADMRAAMKEAMLYWVKNADVDGFRCDYADGVPTDFWKEAVTAVRGIKKDAVMLAESSDSRYLTAGFDYIYGWPYKTALKKLFDGGSVSDFQTALKNESAAFSSDKHVLRFVTNHDQASDVSPVSEFKSADGALAAFVVTAFVGESPLIYSSQETGYDKALSFFDVIVMDWNGKRSYTQKYEKLMAVYDSVSGIRKGAPKFYSTGSILSMYYENGDKALLVLVNTGKDRLEVKTPMERAGDKMKDELGGGTVTLSNMLSLNGYEYKIYTK